MGLTLTRDDNGNAISFNVITMFRHQVRRFVEAVPMAGMEDETNPDSGSMVFDMGGVTIEYMIEFEETFSDANSMQTRYREIEGFFASLTILTGLKIDYPEIGISGRKGVAKVVEIEMRGGEVNVLRGRVELLGGELA